jgi:hypothetical protein
MAIVAKPLGDTSGNFPGSPSTLYVATDTYENLVTLGTAGGIANNAQVWVSDAGVNGSPFFYVSSSNRLLPVGGSYLHDQLLGLNLVKAPTFTGTNDGAITLGSTLNNTFPKCFMYFLANTVNASQPAGWYYTEMSTSTAGIVYNNTYTPAAGVYPTEPSSKTAFSGAVPGGAGATSAVTMFVFREVPGGMLGNYGSVLTDISVEGNATGTKTFTVLLDGNAAGSATITTSPQLNSRHKIANRASTARQRSSGSLINTLSGVAPGNLTVDTSVNKSVSIQIASDVGTSSFVCYSLAQYVEVFS